MNCHDEIKRKKAVFRIRISKESLIPIQRLEINTDSPGFGSKQKSKFWNPGFFHLLNPDPEVTFVKKFSFSSKSSINIQVKMRNFFLIIRNLSIEGVFR